MPKEDLLKEFEEITKIAEKEKPKPALEEGKKAEVKEKVKKEEKKQEEKSKPAKEEKKDVKKEEMKEIEEKKEEKVGVEIEEEVEEKENSLKYIGGLFLILGIIIYIYAFYARLVLQMRILYWSGWIALAGAGLFAIGGGLVSKYRRR